jgi:hypothetical protein
MRGCGKSYDSHTYDTVCVLQCKHNVARTEAARVLAPLGPLLTEHKIDGLVFMAHPKGYVIEAAIEDE